MTVDTKKSWWAVVRLIGILILTIICASMVPAMSVKGGGVISAECGVDYEDAGAVAVYRGQDISSDIITKNEVDSNNVGRYAVSYAIEKNNFKTVGQRIVKIEDTVAPEISLNPDKIVFQDDEYEDPGAEAIDVCNGNLSEKIEVDNQVDTSEIGEYEVKYKVSDDSGNIAEATRIVSVRKKPDGIIYLTFDDGPSSTITARLLDVLKEKSVKATFFVINHSESLDHLIIREHDEGHTVALHSWSHNYQRIYTSESAFFDDLNAISNKVERLIGEKVYLMRFPGGSSNTVSRKYNRGIMSRLTNMVHERGYHYFDWNVGSGDAGEAHSADDVYNNVTSHLQKGRANVVLMHDFENNYKTLDAISRIIDFGIENGYTFYTLDMGVPEVRHGVNN